MQLLGHPSLVSGESHDIYTNYMYLCDEVPGVLRDIRITLKPVGKFISLCVYTLYSLSCMHMHTHTHTQVLSSKATM